MTDNIAGVEIAGLKFGGHDGLEFDRLENDRPECGRLEKDGMQIFKLYGHWLRHVH